MLQVPPLNASLTLSHPRVRDKRPQGMDALRNGPMDVERSETQRNQPPNTRSGCV